MEMDVFQVRTYVRIYLCAHVLHTGLGNDCDRPDTVT